MRSLREGWTLPGTGGLLRVRLGRDLGMLWVGLGRPVWGAGRLGEPGCLVRGVSSVRELVGVGGSWGVVRLGEPARGL